MKTNPYSMFKSVLPHAGKLSMFWWEIGGSMVISAAV